MIRMRNCNENTARNFNCVEIGNLDLYFSYETIVAFRAPDTGLVVSENIWSPTTGKHLNWLDDGDKKGRTPHNEFEDKLQTLLKERGLD